jgi:hypothetical protein
MARLVAVGATLAVSMTTAPSAPAAQYFPSGTAIVAITGGEAIISKVGPGKYRIVFPASQNIKWLGEVRGQSGARIGSFTEQGLVSRWAGIRNGSKAPAQATLSWKGRSRWVSTKVSSPRINKQGLLVVDLTTSEALPSRVKGFNLSIDRAPGTKNPRFNTSTQTYALTDSVSLVTTINGNVNISTKGESSGVECLSFSSQKDGEAIPFTGECGDVQIEYPTIARLEGATSELPGSLPAVIYATDSSNVIEISVNLAVWAYQAS